jgi:hypothetical protein
MDNQDLILPQLKGVNALLNGAHFYKGGEIAFTYPGQHTFTITQQGSTLISKTFEDECIVQGSEVGTFYPGVYQWSIGQLTGTIQIMER